MTKNELEAIASSIYESELVIQSSTDIKIIDQAKRNIMEQSGKLFSLNDFIFVDEYIQKKLEKNKK